MSVLKVYNGSSWVSVPVTLDHGTLTGLLDDDHTQYIHNMPTTSSRNLITATTSTVTGLSIKEDPLQIANSFEVQNSATTVIAHIAAGGKGFFNGIDGNNVEATLFADPTSAQSLATKNYVDVTHTAGDAHDEYMMKFPTSAIRNRLRSSGGDFTGLTVAQGAIQSTANLQEWQNSSFTVLADVDITGKGTFAGLDGGHTTGSILFQDASGIDEDNDELYWDDTNKRMTVGGQANTITVNGSSNAYKMGVHLDGVADTAGMSIRRFGDTAAAGAINMWSRSRGSEGAESAVQDNDIIAAIYGTGHDGTDYHTMASMRMVIEGTVANNDVPGSFEFHVNTGDVADALAMTIHSTKDVTVVGDIAAANIDTTPTADHIPLSGASDTYIDEDWLMRERIIQLQTTSNTLQSGTPSDVTWETEDFKESVYTHSASSAEVTINKTGRFEFHINMTFECTTGTARSGMRFQLEEDSGGGYAFVAGTYRTTYNRTANEGSQSASCVIQLDVTSGDKFKVTSARIYGTAGIRIDVDGCLFLIKEIRGADE